MDDQEKIHGILIPKEKLSPEILGALIEEFVLREGTDYGTKEYSLIEKKEQVLKQLKAGHVKILFDPSLETTNLIRSEDLLKLRRQNLEILE